MSGSPTTRPSLLLRIRDARDEQAWSQFVEIYGPLLYGFARKQRLQDADAADLTQEALRAVSKAARQFDYDPGKGSFRGWLFAVVRSKLRNFLAVHNRQVQGTGDTETLAVLNEQPTPENDQESEWDQEYDGRLFAWAAEQVRGGFQASTWQAFWQTAVENKSGKEVARKLRMSVAAVYLAKSRVMARIREQIQLVQET